MDRLITAKEAAEILPVSERTIRRYASDKKIPSRKVGPKLVFFRLSDIKRFLEKGF